jgi:hypothetical protein
MKIKYGLTNRYVKATTAFEKNPAKKSSDHFFFRRDEVITSVIPRFSARLNRNKYSSGRAQ